MQAWPTMRDEWDLVVVGAGPAGSATALSALRTNPDARVLLLDRADFPRDKACGDGVAPHALDVLAQLEVTNATDRFRPVSRLRLRSPGGSEVVRPMRRDAYVIPRTVLDARLCAAAVAAGATLARHQVRRVSIDTRRVVVDGEIGGRVLVGADGAESVVRRSLGLSAPPDGHVAVAIRGYARAPADLCHEQVIVMAKGGWPAYAWSFPVGDGSVNVGYGEVLQDRPLTRAHLLDRLATMLPGLGPDPATLRAHRLPLSSRRPRQPDGRVLLAGDAASLINPLSGEGIFYAVLSGALAGAGVRLGAGAGAAYRRALRRRLVGHLRHTSSAAWLASRGGVVDAGVATARRHQHAFDDLVDLGLGDGRLTARALVAIGRESVASLARSESASGAAP